MAVFEQGNLQTVLDTGPPGPELCTPALLPNLNPESDPNPLTEKDYHRFTELYFVTKRLIDRKCHAGIKWYFTRVKFKARLTLCDSGNLVLW